ncbi:MAG TPA: hypothetical protein VF721_11890 [Pyrinomonadaceae bacterium]|jgi:hypothetical protein
MAIPEKLLKTLEELKHPALTQTGATITTDGQWALLAQVRKGIKVPIKEIEKAAGNFPVVYEEEEETLPIARPAFPSEGE